MILAPATCGFLPIHVYESPELERAKTICHAINQFAMESMGLGKADAEKIADLSLRDMLDALEVVERWNARPRMHGVASSSTMVPAERLIAAVYTLIHFRELRPIGDEDGDTMPVRFTQRRWGTEYVHFLLVGNRDASTVQREEEEVDAA